MLNPARSAIGTFATPGLLLLLSACTDFGVADSAPDSARPGTDTALAGKVIISSADGDGDGYDGAVDDCDDTNAAINPGASESDNLTDDDCDDYVDEDFVSAGDLIVTEVNRYSVLGTAGAKVNAAWVEVYNNSSRTVDMSNWTLARGITTGQQIALDPATAPILAPGDYATFCDTDDYVGASTAYPLACDYVWGDETQSSTYQSTYHNNVFYLRRDSDRVAFYINGNRTTGTLVDGVSYYYDATNGYWPRQLRFSMSLDAAYYDSGLNDNLGAWCSTNENAANSGVSSTSWRWYDVSGTALDEYGTPGADGSDCTNDPDLDGDGYTGDTDCDETDATVNPGATEVCDGIDNDCDGAIDNAGGYADVDGDGYGDAASPGGCSGGGTYVTNDDDCDDTNASINPTGTESDDGVDQDCDGWVDEDFVAVGDIVVNEINRRSSIGGTGVQNNASWVELYNASARTIDLDNWVFARGTSSSGNQVYIDPAAGLSVAPGGYVVLCDSDDYEGSSVSYPLACDYVWGDESQGTGYVGTYHDNTMYIRRDADTLAMHLAGDRTTGTAIDSVVYVLGWTNKVRFSIGLDPDAADATVNDNSAAWCSPNNGTASTSWRWYDTSATTADEYGTPGAANYDCASDIDGDGVTDVTDCDDLDATVYPGATEICDGLDNDCDLSIDEGLPGTVYYADADLDSYGNPAVTATACAGAPSGYVLDNTDCDDTNAAVNPAAAEICGNGIDDDCIDDDTVCEFSGTQEIKDSYDFRAYGTAASMAVGTAVCNNGDYNGDGYDDVVVGQGFYDGTATDMGRTNLWYGPVDTSDSLTSADLTIDGDTSRNSDQFGSTTRFAGDVDNDGWDDLISSAWRSHTDDRGTAYLFLGGNVGTSVSTADASFTRSTTVSTAYVGFAVDGGEANGDANSDILVSAYGYSSGIGQVAYYDGSTVSGAEDLGTTSTALITGTIAAENLGYAIAMGDLDNDGMADFVLGAPSASSATATGSVYVFLGGGSLSGAVASTAADYTLTGSAAADRLGLSVAYLGDHDGDGTGDFATGADRAGASEQGAVYIITTTPGASTTAAAAAESVITGEVATDFFGRTLAGVGDANADLTGDMMVGATAYDYGALSGAGAAYFFYGPVASGSSSASAYDARFTGANTNDAVGYAISGGGDVNNDGLADWMSSATSWDGFGYGNSGGSWLYYGAGQ